MAMSIFERFDPKGDDNPASFDLDDGPVTTIEAPSK
jgi:hypothetical protein